MIRLPPTGRAHMRSSLPLTRLLRGGTRPAAECAFRLTPEEFTYAFVNTFSEEDAAAVYERYAVPETGQIFYEGEFANFHLQPPTEVHFKSEDRSPLLIVGATEDHTVPASLAKAQYKRSQRSPSRTDYLARGPAASAHGCAGLAGGCRRDRQLARWRPRRARADDPARFPKSSRTTW
jgi:hypothetical protein